jgi:hypothetical protein
MNSRTKKMSSLATIAVVVALTIMAFSLSVSAQKPTITSFVAHLSGDQQVPPVVTNAQGQAIFSLSKEGTELQFKLIVANINNITEAHIHLGPAGTNGPVVAILYPGPTIGGRFDGVLAEGNITAANLTGPLAGMPLSALIDNMTAGNTYVNVHTTQNPKGEIRGQILTATSADAGNIGFGFNAQNISGFPTGAAFLTGGGVYNPSTGFLHTGGGFRCLAAINQGPLSGCEEGQGVRWDSSVLNESTTFKCTGSPSEALKTAVTDNNTVVMTADFYRQGDGNNESFTAKMFVADTDMAPDIPGIQNVWIQGVGCGDAITNFSQD